MLPINYNVVQPRLLQNTPTARMRSGTVHPLTLESLENSFPHISRLPVLTTRVVYQSPVSNQPPLWQGPGNLRAQSTKHFKVLGEEPQTAVVRGSYTSILTRANLKLHTDTEPTGRSDDPSAWVLANKSSIWETTS